MTALPNRWLIALAGVVMQIALGAVYAWSVFRIPLTEAYGWTISEVTLAFTIAIFVLGFAAFAGGLWMRRAGPRPVALAAGRALRARCLPRQLCRRPAVVAVLLLWTDRAASASASATSFPLPRWSSGFPTGAG